MERRRLQEVNLVTTNHFDSAVKLVCTVRLSKVLEKFLPSAAMTYFKTHNYRPVI